MPTVKMQGKIMKFPYTKKGKIEAKKAAKKNGKMVAKAKRKSK